MQRDNENHDSVPHGGARPHTVTLKETQLQQKLLEVEEELTRQVAVNLDQEDRLTSQDNDLTDLSESLREKDHEIRKLRMRLHQNSDQKEFIQRLQAQVTQKTDEANAAQLLEAENETLKNNLEEQICVSQTQQRRLADLEARLKDKDSEIEKLQRLKQLPEGPENKMYQHQLQEKEQHIEHLQAMAKLQTQHLQKKVKESENDKLIIEQLQEQLEMLEKEQIKYLQTVVNLQAQDVQEEQKSNPNDQLIIKRLEEEVEMFKALAEQQHGQTELQDALKLKEEIKELERKNQQLLEDYDSLVEYGKKLLKDKEEKMKTCIASEMKELKAYVEGLQTDNCDLQQMTNLLHSEIEMYQQQLQEKEQHIESLQTAASLQAEDLQKTQNDFSDAKETIKHLEEQVEVLKTQIQSSDQHEMNLDRGTIKEKNIRNEHLCRTVQQYEKDMQILVKRLQEAREEAQSMQELYMQQRRLEEVFKTQSQSHDQHEMNLDRATIEKNIRIERLCQTVQQYEQDVQILVKRLQEARKKAQSIYTFHRQQKRLEELEEALKLKNTALLEHSQRAADFTRKTQEQQKGLQAQSSQIEKLKTTIKEKEISIEHLRKTVQKCELEKHTLVKQLQEAKEVQSMHTLHKQQQRLDELEETLKKKDTALLEQRRRVADVTKKAEELERSLQAKSTKIEKLENNMAAEKAIYDVVIERCHASYSALMSQLKQQEEKVKALSSIEAERSSLLHRCEELESRTQQLQAASDQKKQKKKRWFKCWH